jgi:hypothetical protein
MSMDRVLDGVAVWSYLFGTSEPAKREASEQEQLQHLHWDRQSRSWTSVEGARDDLAA